MLFLSARLPFCRLFCCSCTGSFCSRQTVRLSAFLKRWRLASTRPFICMPTSGKRKRSSAPLLPLRGLGADALRELRGLHLTTWGNTGERGSSLPSCDVVDGWSRDSALGGEDKRLAQSPQNLTFNPRAYSCLVQPLQPPIGLLSNNLWVGVCPCNLCRPSFDSTIERANDCLTFLHRKIGCLFLFSLLLLTRSTAFHMFRCSFLTCLHGC